LLALISRYGQPGFNGFPRDKETKLRLIVHVEVNAILNAARVGIPLKGCKLYLACTDDTGAVWGGPPCTRCSLDVIQSGKSLSCLCLSKSASPPGRQTSLRRVICCVRLVCIISRGGVYAGYTQVDFYNKRPFRHYDWRPNCGRELAGRYQPAG
jgi:Cytidine and deoxycytidylate deaminase zinc-binding region